jgi:acetyl esterase/lipase
MLQAVLLVLAVTAPLAAVLTWRPAPPVADLWKAAIAAGEFGHWAALLALALAVVGAKVLVGGPRIAVVLLAATGAALLLRPALVAARLGAGLPDALAAAFGPGARAAGPAFSVARLYGFGPKDAAGAAEEHVFARPDGEALALTFHRAAGAPAGGAPCLVVVHGGGWDSGDRTQLAAWNTRWAARGFAVAAVSYRLAPRHPWPAAGEDVRAALGWLRARAPELGVDPARLVLVGRSAGGQIAAAVAYGAPDAGVAGLVAFYAPFDMAFAWGVSREDDALNSVKLMRQYLGGPPDTPERQALYASASAQLMVGPRTPPTLLLHGRPDALVWYRHSERLAARLREAGVPHLHLELPWATHGFDFNPDGPGGQLADHAIDAFVRALPRRA